MPTVNKIKKGNVVRNEGQPCLVLECAIRTPPNNASYCQMSLRVLSTGKIQNLRLPVSADFEVLENEIRRLEFSYVDGDVYTFTDPDSFETIEIDKILLEDCLDFLVPNQPYDIFFVEDKPCTVSLPAAIEMVVAEATEGLKGDSSGGSTKPVTMETGLVVNVPLFIKKGERLRINTETRQYLQRA